MPLEKQSKSMQGVACGKRMRDLPDDSRLKVGTIDLEFSMGCGSRKKLVGSEVKSKLMISKVQHTFRPGTRASQSVENRKRSTHLDQYFIPDSSNTVSWMHSAEPELSRDQRNSISAGQARGTRQLQSHRSNH
ncbi:hypothetical protein DPX16_16102 [Anabarilius grahami]|uniref:Uncharacterized protein n=1 Tax=Anabarilius grahami TaxID=495550 RepID=A0A3N0YP47_ANAGA|nr:hypothetical protein DPX16_16102 [Anabarilius grahami]